MIKLRHRRGSVRNACVKDPACLKRVAVTSLQSPVAGGSACGAAAVVAIPTSSDSEAPETRPHRRGGDRPVGDCSVAIVRKSAEHSCSASVEVLLERKSARIGNGYFQVDRWPTRASQVDQDGCRTREKENIQGFSLYVKWDVCHMRCQAIKPKMRRCKLKIFSTPTFIATL